MLWALFSRGHRDHAGRPCAALSIQTTSRVDVDLGARPPRYLLALPMAHLESRRIGDPIAWVRKLDTLSSQPRPRLP